MHFCPGISHNPTQTIITVNHKGHSNFTLTFPNKSSVTGLQIKKKIKKERGFNQTDQTILYNNRVLGDYENLPTSISHCLCTKKRGGCVINCPHISGNFNSKTVTLITSGCAYNPPYSPQKVNISLNMNISASNLTISPNATVKQLKDKILKNINMSFNGRDITHSGMNHQRLSNLGVMSGNSINLSFDCQYIDYDDIVILPTPTPIIYPNPVITNQTGGIDIYSSNTVNISAPAFPPNPSIPRNAPTNTVVIGSNQGPVYESQMTTDTLNNGQQDYPAEEEHGMVVENEGNNSTNNSGVVTRIAIEEKDCNFKSNYFFSGEEKLENLVKKWRESRGVKDDSEYLYELYFNGKKLDLEGTLNQNCIGSGEVLELRKEINENEWANA